MTTKGAALAALVLALAPAGCKSAAEAEGAKQGALMGALGAGISSVVWGRNDPLGDAARGAVVGGTMGAISGSMADQRARERAAGAGAEDELRRENEELARRNAELELERRLVAAIGPENTEAVRLVGTCRHDDALARARAGQASANPEFAQAGLWLEAVIELDRRATARARALYPRLAEVDPDVATADEAEAVVLDLLGRLEDARAEFGLPRRCE